jgi:hypothetical protein
MMTRLKALKISMVVFGTFYLLAPTLYLLFTPDAFRWSPFSQPYEHLIIGIYAALGICLLMAVKNPLSNIIIIDFTILSSIFAGGSMTYNALYKPGENIHLFIDVPLFYLIAIIFILLYPRKLKPQETTEVTADKTDS